MGIEEPFKWGKFFGGLFAPINFAKSFVSMVQIGLILAFLTLSVLGGLYVWRKTKPKPPSPPVAVENNAGTIHSSADDYRKTCFLSFCF